MGQVHSHLSEEERQIIQIEIDNGTSIRRIAGLIGRHASTVSREIVLLQCLLGGFGSVFPQHPIEHIHTPTPSWTGSYTTPPSWKPANTTCANTRPSGSRPPITMFGRPRWSGPGRRFRYDFPALSSMIRGCCRRERGRPMTADRNQAGYTDASGAHGAGLLVMWVRRGRPDSSEPAATGKPS